MKFTFQKIEIRRSVSMSWIAFLLISVIGAISQVSSFVATTTIRKIHTELGRTVPQELTSLVESPLLLFSTLPSTKVERMDNDETLLVMSLSPLPSVSQEESFDRISQYTRGFPFAVLLPHQPIQALPTEDGGLEIKFMRRTSDMKIIIDGGVRFFVRDVNEKGRIEVSIKRILEGRKKLITPNIATLEKMIVRSFSKAMAIGSDAGNPRTATETRIDSTTLPKTRIASPTKDTVQIQSIFHKWIWTSDNESMLGNI